MDDKCKWVEGSWTRKLDPPFPAREIREAGYDLKKCEDQIGVYWVIIRKTLDGK